MILQNILHFVEPLQIGTNYESVITALKDISFVPIIDENSMPVGILDINKLVCSNIDYCNFNILDYCIDCQIAQSLDSLSDIIIVPNFKGLIVVKDNKYLGVVTPCQLLLSWESRWQKQNQELLRIAANNKRAQKQELTQKNAQTLSTLVAGVAHEINTPLGICVTAVSNLEEKTKTFFNAYKQGLSKKSHFEEYINLSLDTTEMVLLNLQTTKELIKEFKLVSVKQDGDIKAKEFNLLETIKKVCKKLSPETNKKNIEVLVNGNSNVFLLSNKHQFGQIVTNLIMNSLIHGYKNASHGTIKFYVDCDDKNFSIVYSDDGSGIDESIMPHIFEPFFTTARGTGGTGLGMHIVYNIITQTFGGTIRCFSSQIGGARFSITAPINFIPKAANEQ